MSFVLAIDPGTKALGLALFENGELLRSAVIRSFCEDRYTRTRVIMAELAGKDSFNQYVEVVCEEPLLQGKANTAMQRLLGALEQYFIHRINYIHPLTVKKAMGRGTLDKLEVALEAGARMNETWQQDYIARLITGEQWDQTDAIAIGLTYFQQQKEKEKKNGKS